MIDELPTPFALPAATGTPGADPKFPKPSSSSLSSETLTASLAVAVVVVVATSGVVLVVMLFGVVPNDASSNGNGASGTLTRPPKAYPTDCKAEGCKEKKPPVAVDVDVVVVVDVADRCGGCAFVFVFVLVFGRTSAALCCGCGCTTKWPCMAIN